MSTGEEKGRKVAEGGGSAAFAAGYSMNEESKPSGRPPRAPRPANARRGAEIDDPVQKAIGDKLRAVFEEVVQQPVPDRFVELLRKLEQQERGNK